MSGSGGGVGGFSPQFDSCESLVIDTQLSSPKQAVVERISVGDTLIISTQNYGGAAVVVAIYQGEVAGGLAAPEIGRLRTCIEDGTQYLAKVVAKNDGQVRVRVTAG